MKKEDKLLPGSGIELVSEEKTVASELHTRYLTSCRINRSIINITHGASNSDVFTGFPLNILEGMKVENDHYVKKLKELKASVSPFRHIVAKQSASFEEGAIITDSWGYEQTNIDFYCIVKRSGMWVTILPMTKNTIGNHRQSMTTKEMPGEIDFTADPKRKKLDFWNNREQGFSLRDYISGGYCNLWNGKEETATHYA